MKGVCSKPDEPILYLLKIEGFFFYFIFYVSSDSYQFMFLFSVAFFHIFPIFDLSFLLFCSVFHFFPFLFVYDNAMSV